MTPLNLRCDPVRFKPMWKSIVMALALTSLLAAAAAADRAVFPGTDWKTAKPASQGLSPAGVDRVGKWLEENGSKTGLMVRHGRIVGEWYFDGTDATTQLLVYSTTKSFSSTAAGIAIADGKLKLDSTVGQFLPDVQPAEKKQITVGQILSMTTGVHNNKKLDYVPDPFTYAMLEAPVDFRPGEKWDYNNTGLSLLTPLFQAATGQGIDQFLDARVFQPIGITPADWSWDRKADQPLPYSGLHITARRWPGLVCWCCAKAAGRSSRSCRPIGSPPRPVLRNRTTRTMATCGGTIPKASGLACRPTPLRRWANSRTTC